MELIMAGETSTELTFLNCTLAFWLKMSFFHFFLLILDWFIMFTVLVVLVLTSQPWCEYVGSPGTKLRSTAFPLRVNIADMQVWISVILQETWNLFKSDMSISCLRPAGTRWKEMKQSIVSFSASPVKGHKKQSWERQPAPWSVYITGYIKCFVLWSRQIFSATLHRLPAAPRVWISFTPNVSGEAQQSCFTSESLKIVCFLGQNIARSVWALMFQTWHIFHLFSLQGIWSWPNM